MNSQEIDITGMTEKDIREMIDLLEEAGKGLDEATKNLKDAYKCMLTISSIVILRSPLIPFKLRFIYPPF